MPVMKDKDVLTAEAMAAMEGLELAECGLHKAVLEVDCSELKTTLESE